MGYLNHHLKSQLFSPRRLILETILGTEPVEAEILPQSTPGEKYTVRMTYSLHPCNHQGNHQEAPRMHKSIS